MGLKSNWAYNNGKKEDAKVSASLKAEKNGWIKRDGIFLYAERNKYDVTNLIVKTYANKKQADAMVEKQKAIGIDAYRSLKHPFIILTSKINNYENYRKSTNW